VRQRNASPTTTGRTRRASAAAAAAGPTRRLTAGHFALTLEGQVAGLLKSAEGGFPSAEVVKEKPDGGLVKKHLGPIRYEDFTVQFGLGMDKALQAWIDETLDGKGSRRSGTVEAADATMNVQSVQEFEHALITQIGIPACDGASKDAAFLTLSFAPEFARTGPGGGTLSKSTQTAKQKKWVASNFRFELGDLPTKRVSKVAAFTIRQSIPEHGLGEIREYEKQPAVLEIPNIKVTFAEVDHEPWDEWFQDFVVRGNAGDEQELSGKIAFLDPTLKTELVTIDLEHVGIYRLTPAPAPAGSESVRRWVAELYVEHVKLTLS
jgi:hypothetical protein